MKKRLIILTALAVTTISITGCYSYYSLPEVQTAEQSVSSDTETDTKADTETDAIVDAANGSANGSANDAKAETDATNDESESPVMFEDFEGDTNLAIQRGEDETLTVIDDNIAGSKVLSITGRTDTWNGANFACDEFRGNTIRANASVRSAAKTVRISIQYEVSGAPVYNWIVSSAGNADKYTLLTGTFAIPDDVANIFVYIESDSCDDIFIDEVKVTCEGTYKKPGEIAKPEMADISEYKSMKELYAPYFDIGVCINPMVIANEDYKNLILQQFSSVTNENNLKPESILDKEACLSNLENGGEDLCINMDNVKDELDFAVANHLKVRGHTLIWHSQTPDWIFYENYDPKGNLADRELMLKRVDNYMNHVFSWADENYPGLFYAWDVVNEAVEDNGKLRDSLWYETIGEDYVEQVFAIARKYAPEGVKLFYNDYNSFMASKQKGIIEMLTPIAKAGNIDGVGMQAHLYTGEEPAHFARAAKTYADELGVIIHVTEMDVTQPAATSPEGEQGNYYGDLFKALREARESGVPIESVSIWGLCDNMSWKAGEKPLLFNADLSGKLAFYEVLQAAEK